MGAVKEKFNINKNEEVIKAVNLIKKGSSLHFFGTGASGLICLDAYQKFRRIGVNCFAHTDGHDQITNAVLLGENDICVIFSYSGKTEEIKKTFEILKETGAPTIIVTKYRKNCLLEGADAYLYVLTPEVTVRSGAMGSRIAMLAIVDILLLSILSTDYEKYEEKLLATYAAIHKINKNKI